MNHPTSPDRRRLLALASASGLLALLSPAWAAESKDNTTWESLMPKGWDPMKGFKGRNLQGLMDGDPKAQALMDELRASWDQAPTVPEMNGRSVRIAGYVVPLEEGKGELREFLLVPYFGACIHTPPPPANQIIHVSPAQPVKGIKGMSPVWASGTLKIRRDESSMGVSGYHLEAIKVEPYEERASR